MVSVIVPFYNSESHIARCIESILNQSYEKLELILIDDGSTDCSKRICKEYRKKDDRIKIISKDNGGVSSSRNLGLKMAKGEYVTFVDADDYLENDFLSNAMSVFSKEKVDIVRSPYIRKVGPKKSIQRFNMPYDSVIKKENYLDSVYKNIGLGNTIDTACTNVFKTNLVRGLKFDEKIDYGEDTLFMIEALELSKEGIYVIDKPAYVYVYNKEESTNSFNSAKWIRKLRLFKEVFMTKANACISKNHGDGVAWKYLVEKFTISINGIMHMSIANNKLSAHRAFIGDIVTLINEDKNMGIADEYCSKLKRTGSVFRFLCLKLVYKGKKIAYNILATRSNNKHNKACKDYNEK